MQQGDDINIHYNGRDYHIKVVETKPDPVISIVEADINLEFEEPMDYAHHMKMKKTPSKVEKDLETKVLDWAKKNGVLEKY